MSGINFLPNAFGDMREDVNMLIRRDWQKDDLQDQREDIWRRQRETDALQREFAQHGIRWRVEDAAAAGLHPLFALGGGGAAYSPTIAVGAAGGVPDSGSSNVPELPGQDVSGAARRGMTPEEKEMMDLRLQLLRSQIQHQDALTNAIDAKAAKDRQGDVSGGGAVSTEGALTSHPLFADAVKPKPADMISRESGWPGVTAHLGQGRPHMAEMVSPGGGFRYLWPISGDGGPSEDLDVTLVPLLLGANVERFGWRWIPNLFRHITGQSWTRKYNVERGLRQFGEWMQSRGWLGTRQPSESQLESMR